MMRTLLCVLVLAASASVAAAGSASAAPQAPPPAPLPAGKAAEQAAKVEELRARAEQGDAAAQLSLGLAYAIGQGVPRDYAQAAAWYRTAAEQG